MQEKQKETSELELQLSTARLEYNPVRLPMPCVLVSCFPS